MVDLTDGGPHLLFQGQDLKEIRFARLPGWGHLDLGFVAISPPGQLSSWAGKELMSVAQAELRRLFPGPSELS